MTVSMAVFWAVVIGLVTWTVSRLRPADHGSARSILEEHFARGEISREEFDQRNGAIEGR